MSLGDDLKKAVENVKKVVEEVVDQITGNTPNSESSKTIDKEKGSNLVIYQVTRPPAQPNLPPVSKREIAEIAEIEVKVYNSEQKNILGH